MSAQLRPLAQAGADVGWLLPMALLTAMFSLTCGALNHDQGSGFNVVLS